MKYGEFLGSMSPREYEIYRAGAERAQRNGWMLDARSYRVRDYHQEAMRSCVRSARLCNQRFIAHVRAARDMAAKQRKAA
jgi:hypothetical protein